MSAEDQLEQRREWFAGMRRGRSMNTTSESVELADDAIKIVGPCDLSDVALICPALVEIESIRRSLVMSLLTGADRAGLIAALDRAESNLRRRFAP